MIPVPGTKVTVGGGLEPLGRVPRLGEAVREGHREAGGVRGRDQLLRARLAVRASSDRAAQLTSSGPNAPEPTSSIVPTRSSDRRSRSPCTTLGSHVAPPQSFASSSAHANGRARPDRAPRTCNPRRPPRTARSNPAASIPVGAAADVELGRDDQVALSLDLVHVTVHVHVEPLGGVRRPVRARPRATSRSSRRAPRRAAPPGSSSRRLLCDPRRQRDRQLGTRRCPAVHAGAARREFPSTSPVASARSAARYASYAMTSTLRSSG